MSTTEKEVSYKISGKDVSGPAVDSAVSNMKKLSREEELANKKRLQDQQNYWLAWHAYQEKIEREQKESQARMVQEHEASSAAMTRAILRIYAAYYVLSQAGAVLMSPFVKGFNAVEQYKQSVAETAAMVMSFAEKSPGVSQEEQWKQALTYAKGMVPVLEDIAAKTLLSGQETIALSNAFARSGVFLDATNEKQIEAFTRISNALPLLTNGQEIMRQINTEVRSLMTGQNEASSMLLQTLKAIDPEIEKHLKTWREQGTVMENIGALLSGFGPATDLLENTWEAVKSTIDTTANQVLRGAMAPAYEAIIGQVKEIDKYLKEHKSQVQNGIYLSWMSLVGVLQTVQGFFKPMTPELQKMAEWSKELASFLSFTAYAILPPLAEKLGFVFKAMWQSLQGDGLNGVRNAWATLQAGFATDFSAEVDRRTDELILKLNEVSTLVKPPKGAYTDPDADKAAADEKKRLAKKAADEKKRLAKEAADEEKRIATETFNEANRLYDAHISRNKEQMREFNQEVEAYAREQLRITEDLLRQESDLYLMRRDAMWQAISDSGMNAGMQNMLEIYLGQDIYSEMIAAEKQYFDDSMKNLDAFITAHYSKTNQWLTKEEAMKRVQAQKDTNIAKLASAQQLALYVAGLNAMGSIAGSMYQAMGEKGKAFFYIQQALAVAGAVVSTLLAAQMAYASQLIPGDPTSLARAQAAWKYTMVLGMINAAAIAATAIGNIASMNSSSSDSGGGGATASTYTAPASTDTGSTDTGTTTKTDKYVYHTYEITVMGNIVDQDAFARELIGSLRKAEEDNA